jgi:pyridoxine 5'-phosphate synthase PdxJ
MSNEQHKEQHSKRLHQKETHVAKQVKIAKAYGISVKEPHKLAKHNAMNCGDPNCLMCMNPRKAFNEKTIQERRFDQPLAQGE